MDFNYTLHKLPEAWRIFDTRIHGISQPALTRSQFVYIMNKQGFDALMHTLREKTKNFARKEHR